MSAGCIPIVIGKGGQKEIVTKDCGRLCDNAHEIAEATLKLIKQPKTTAGLSNKSIKRADDFSIAQFNKHLSDLL